MAKQPRDAKDLFLLDDDFQDDCVSFRCLRFTLLVNLFIFDDLICFWIAAKVF